MRVKKGDKILACIKEIEVLANLGTFFVLFAIKGKTKAIKKIKKIQKKRKKTTSLCFFFTYISIANKKRRK